MSTSETSLEVLAPQSFRFYRRALEVMQRAEIPFLVGGAYAFGSYTGIVRHTKDLDLFVHRDDFDAALRAFRTAGYHAELVFDHWLGKAWNGDDFIDLIFNSGNSLCPVDARWFEHSVAANVFGIPVRIAPAEEMIWQKMFIMERERYDGADVNHLIRARGRRLDWDRIVERAGPHWRVLLSHLILFGYVYPDDRGSVPSVLMERLSSRLAADPANRNGESVCQGTNLSRLQYVADTETWGYEDARVTPRGGMSAQEALAWTDAGRCSS